VYSDTLAKVLYSLDPRKFNKVDYVFLFSFLVLLIGALVMFQTQNVTVAMISLVGIFLAFFSMILCVGLEDLFEREELENKQEEKDESRQRVANMKRN